MFISEHPQCFPIFTEGYAAAVAQKQLQAQQGKENIFLCLICSENITAGRRFQLQRLARILSTLFGEEAMRTLLEV